jgi:hypothetical protein
VGHYFSQHGTIAPFIDWYVAADRNTAAAYEPRGVMPSGFFYAGVRILISGISALSGLDPVMDSK